MLRKSKNLIGNLFITSLLWCFAIVLIAFTLPANADNNIVYLREITTYIVCPQSGEVIGSEEETTRDGMEDADHPPDDEVVVGTREVYGLHEVALINLDTGEFLGRSIWRWGWKTEDIIEYEHVDHPKTFYTDPPITRTRQARQHDAGFWRCR